MLDSCLALLMIRISSWHKAEGASFDCWAGLFRPILSQAPSMFLEVARFRAA